MSHWCPEPSWFFFKKSSFHTKVEFICVLESIIAINFFS
jgi:hypothetical protein